MTADARLRTNQFPRGTHLGSATSSTRLAVVVSRPIDVSRTSSRRCRRAPAADGPPHRRCRRLAIVAPPEPSSRRRRRAPSSSSRRCCRLAVAIVSQTSSRRHRSAHRSRRLACRRAVVSRSTRSRLRACLDTRSIAKQFTAHRGSAAAAMLPRRSSRCDTGRVVRWQQRKQPNINADERITQLRSTLAARDKSGVRHLE